MELVKTRGQIRLLNPGNTFERRGRAYFLDGARIPSVTTCLRGAGLLADLDRIPPDVLERAAERGTQVHRHTELLETDSLNWDTVAPDHLAYLDAWLTFVEETGWEAELIEHPVYDPVYRYAGTLDRVGRFTKRGNVEAVVDIKTTSVLRPITALQLAGYRRPLGRPGLRRFAVQLKSNGEYALREYADELDEQVFLGAVRITWWRLLNGIMQWE